MQRSKMNRSVLAFDPMKLATLTFLVPLISFSTLPGTQQTNAWRTRTVRNQLFSVEAPASLRQVESFSGEHNASLERDQRNHWATSYAVIETKPEDSRFGVVVINARQSIIRSQPRTTPDGLYWYLGAVLIGNEDEPDPTSVKEIRVNRLRGWEYTYTDGGVSTRGRIFERGGKIYVVVFIGKAAEDLGSTDAERFLNSFRLRR